MLFRFIKSLIFLNKRMAEVEAVQTREGYRIEELGRGPEYYWTYMEGSREISIEVDFTWFNDVRLYTDSLRKWSEPYGTEVSDFDHQKIINRCIHYFSCWGMVTLDHTILPTTEDLKRSLTEQGIEFKELDKGVIYYSMDADEYRKRHK